jgi:hypothetical protein
MPRPLALFVAFGYLVLQALAAPSVSPSNDTYRYARMTLRVLGESGPAARADALRAYCEDNAAWLARGQRVDPGAFTARYPRDDAVRGCVDASPDGLGPTSPRYDAVFAARIAFPVMAAPLVPVLGVNRALKATSVLLTALGGLITYLVLRLLGLSRPRAALGQALFYAGPVGWWGSFGLTDGPAVAVSMVTLLAVLLLLRRRYALGTALFVGSIAVGGLLRYPNFVFVTLAVLAAAVAGVLTDPRRRRPLLLVAALAAACLAGLAVTAYALHWPGATESLQDMFTGHFARPDVADPWDRLVRLNVSFWSQWAQDQARSPWLVAGVTLGSVALMRRYRIFGVVAVAVALTGLLVQAAHPTVSQGDRLLAGVWVAAALGLPLFTGGLRPTRPADDGRRFSDGRSRNRLHLLPTMDE